MKQINKNSKNKVFYSLIWINKFGIFVESWGNLKQALNNGKIAKSNEEFTYLKSKVIIPILN